MAIGYICEKGHTFEIPAVTRQERHTDHGWDPAEYGCPECGADYHQAVVCPSCEAWVSPDDTVKCENCDKFICETCAKENGGRCSDTCQKERC